MYLVRFFGETGHVMQDLNIVAKIGDEVDIWHMRPTFLYVMCWK